MALLAIEIRNFSKNYGSVAAVKNLSLQIKSGELFGLIGPDGAGKTTTMRTLTTLLTCEQGEMYVAGKDVRTEVPYIRSILGYMPQRFSLYPDLTVIQNLNFFADLFGVSGEERKQRLERLFQFSRLDAFKKRLAKDLSGGMKQKLALSCILIHAPRILILDEPTTGVDPVSRQEFWQILNQLRQEGATILVSTPYMDEASLCDRVAFMHKGSLLALDKPDNLHKEFPYVLYEVTGPDTRLLVPYLQKETGAVAVRKFGDRLHVSFGRKLNETQMQHLREKAPAQIANFESIRPSIEDVFLELMKKQEALS
ncbi:MAG: ATP-binding cassette domain-containing protein [bacterium]